MALEPLQTSDGAERAARISVLFSVIERWLERERDQVALWVPVGLGAGIAAWFVLPDPASWLAWCLACAALACASVLPAEGSRLRAIAAGAGALGCLGCLIIWGKASLAGTPPLTRATFADISATVRTVEPLPARGAVRLIAAPLDRPDLPAALRVTIAEGDLAGPVAPGAVVAFRARLMPPAPPAVPGAYDFAQRAYFLGIGASGRALPPVRIVRPAPRDGIPLRQRLSDHVRASVPGAPGAIAATFATGDRGAIPEADAEAMRRSGLAHLLSISGLHVTALVGTVIFLILRLMALSRRLALRWPLLPIAAAGGAAAGIGYTLLTGSDVPTVRSCVAALLVLGGLALGREAITLRLVAVGALFVLLLWPESLVGPSFQMSFAAVVAIVALAEHPGFRALVSAHGEPVPMRLGRHLLGLFLTGLSVEIVLAPIALFHFHQAGLLGAVANLVAIPLTTFVVMPFEAIALALDCAGLGAPAWWVVEKALMLLLGVAHAVAASPAAVALTPAFPAAAFGLMVAGGLWCLLWRSGARWLGLLPVAAGGAMILLTPRPDILVTGDGHHVAIRAPDGAMAILRPRAGDYVREMLSESAGMDGDLAALESLPSARCSRDLCAVAVDAGPRRWHLLATRSADLVPAARLARDCARADIVVSERRLPRACRPRWLKIDRATLAGTGGVALYLRSGKVRTVRRPGDRHPWITPARPARNRQL